MPDVVVLDAVRTAIGKSFRGSFVGTRSDDLGGHVIDTLLRRNPYLDPAVVTDLYWGCSLPDHSQGYNVARQVGLLAGLPETVPALTLSRSCGSAFSAIRMAAHAIAAGDGAVYLAGGGDSFTMCLGKGFSQADHNPRFVDEGRPDFINHAYMEVFDTAEIVADVHGITRREMDEFAVLSQARTAKAIADGYHAAEIVAYQLPDGTVVDADDSPRPDTTVERLAELRAISPERGGRVTAGNTCVAGDAAAAMVLASAEWASSVGATPQARILGSAVAALAPEVMGLGSIPAVRSLLDRHGLRVSDIDLFEVHENFSAQVIPTCRELGIDVDTQLNPHGGAIALGHPPGMSGCRLVSTVVHGLRARNQHLGVAATCVAGGQGMAVLIERLD
ncbi:thiolase family protein [Streptomyces spiralis]|uniref:thiolase family protein n=1 Tax=Streptomyces spiralis TaxID=66376 RepID=UPI0033FBBD19